MPPTSDRTPRDSAAETCAAGLAEPARFLRKHWLRLLGASAVVLAPCFWHREIVASDLGSHLYNAWLVQLIRHGQAPGLWIAPQRTNVLFDLLLSGFGSILGLRAAEKIAVSLAASGYGDVTGDDVVAHLSQIRARRAILDGEIVCLEPTGRPSFELLQQRMNLRTPDPRKTADQL